MLYTSCVPADGPTKPGHANQDGGRAKQTTGITHGFMLFIFLAMALTALCPPLAMAQERGLIAKIEITGNKRIEAETVKAYLKLNTGEAYDPKKADDSVKNLFATGFFQDVRIDFKAGVMRVTLAENPIVNRIAFEGSKEIKAEDLQKEIKLKAPVPYAKGQVAADVQRILEVYRRQGYYAARVEAKRIDAKDSQVDLVFEIHEGPQTKVTAINFSGNHAFSSADLRGVITTTQSTLLDFIKPTSIYDPDRFNLDRELLLRHYLKNGYADMRVTSAFADMDASAKGFFLTFTISEGPLYKFGAIELEVKLPSLSAEDFRPRVLTNAGQTYNGEQVEKTVEALTLVLAEKGFAFATVRPRMDRNPQSHTISVSYIVEQGARIYIDRINIVGNRITKDDVIRREFRVAEGDAYNKVLVEKAKQRLVKLGFFKTVKVEKEPGPAPDRVVLNVVVEEQSTGELSFGVGYSSNQGVIGDIGYTERNLMGTGQSVSVKVSGSLVSGSALVSWTDPRFLDSNMSFGVDGFVRNNDYRAATGYTVAGYEDLRVGGSLRFGFALTDNITLNTNYTLQRDLVYNLDPNASLAVQQIQGAAIISSVGYSVAYDTRNTKKNPTSGLYIQGGQDLAGLGGDVNYLRTTGEIRGYTPLTSDLTLAVRAMGGTITGWGGQDVRIVDAFYKGGETIAGFASAGLGPRDASTGNALGGNNFYSANAEVRFPIPFLPQDLGLGGAVFTDAGSLFGTNAQNFANAYVKQHGGANTLVVQDSAIVRSSAGMSLIWDSPVGALRLDYATVLTKAPFDKTQPFSFGASGW